MRILKRMAAVGLLAAGLAGCTAMDNTSFETLGLAIGGLEPSISMADVNSVRGPALLVEFGQADALMVLGGLQGGYVRWTGITEHLTTDHGRLVQSAGLPTDIIAPLLVDDPFITGLHRLADGLEVSRQVDYPALYQTGLVQTARYQRGPLESLEIMGQKRELQRIDERVEIPVLGYRALNRYWVDPDDGMVYRSVQHVAPNLPPLRLTLLKPYGAQP